MISQKYWFLILILMPYTFQPTDGMQCSAYFTDLFHEDLVTTEYDAYKALIENPLTQNVNYLAIPWAVLINKKQLDVLDAVLDQKLNYEFTICQHIEFEKIIPILLKFCPKIVLFTPHVQRNKKYPLTVLPFPHAAVNGAEPALTKDLLYSFIGFNTHSIRTKIFNLPHHPDTLIKKRIQWHFSKKKNPIKEREEYQDTLARSHYSLCPRGTGSSTIRFWESLQAQAIPVLYGNDLWLPDEFDWQSCAVLIPEKEVGKTYELLHAIPLEQRLSMQKKCREAYNQFCGKNIVSTIRHYYNRISS